MPFLNKEELNRISGVVGLSIDSGKATTIKSLNSSEDPQVDLIITLNGKNKDGTYTKSFRIRTNERLSDLFTQSEAEDHSESVLEYDAIIVKSLP